mmetsp:Transcript_26849/g.57092  ORF Transcript_26849/g.57092 Transcript_26849/m.57092 type:complete len:422 (-) Transcript_26849:63-1328(-)
MVAEVSGLENDVAECNGDENYETNAHDENNAVSVVGTRLDGDVLARSLAFLPLRQFVSCRLVSSAWKEVATSVRMDEEVILEGCDVRFLPSIARSLGHQIRRIRLDQKANARRIDEDDLAMACISFPNLERLACRHCSHLSFWLSPLLRGDGHALRNLTHLNLHGNERMEWSLSNLRHLPLLVDLRCVNNSRLMGELNDIAVDHPNSSCFTTIDVSGCPSVSGDFLDLRHLLRLGWMGLSRTRVEGDLRRVRPSDFPALQMTGLNELIYGASEIDYVRDAGAVMRARHQWIRRSREDCPIYPFRVGLSRESPEYHERVEQRLYRSERDPPFDIESVQVGNRLGWRWSNCLGGFCKVHWLGPAPDHGSAEYESYWKELAGLHREEESSMFSDFFNPPTPSEYEQLCLLSVPKDVEGSRRQLA